MSVTSPTLIAFPEAVAVAVAVFAVLLDEPPQAASSSASGTTRASFFISGMLLRDDAREVLGLDEHATRLGALVAADDLPPLEHVDQAAGSRVADPEPAL